MISEQDRSAMPVVSILMTSFNRQEFISEAIESVLASTYVYFELIIVDDCSADNTLKIARSFAAKDKRIRVFVNEQNLGDYPNRNRAASYANGKYLKYVDSDDRIYPEALSIMVAMMEQYPDAGFGLCKIADDSIEMHPVVLNAPAAYKHHYFREAIFFASPGQAVFRKEAFDSIGGFPEKRMVGDFEMWHKLSLKFPLLLMPGKLYWIRKHRGQEVSHQNKYVIEYEKIKIRYLFSKDSPLSQQEAGEIIRRRRLTLLKIFLRKMISLQVKEACLRMKIFVFYLLNFNRLKAHG